MCNFLSVGQSCAAPRSLNWSLNFCIEDRLKTLYKMLDSGVEGLGVGVGFRGLGPSSCQQEAQDVNISRESRHALRIKGSYNTREPY